MKNKPEILLTSERNGFVDEVWHGSIYIANNDGIYKYTGFKPDNIVFMRSLAKPIQASIITDCNIINDYNLAGYDIALFCASHAGSREHIKHLKTLLKKTNVKIHELLLNSQIPLDIRGFRGIKTPLHNNCSGKHIMMIAMSKYLGYNPDNYIHKNHPIQKMIKKRQEELSSFKSDILTFDGCGTPLWGLPVKNVIRAYFNFFHDKKYSLITNAILNNSRLYGGNNRLDSEIISLSHKKLFAKVGAGGFVFVYNFQKDEILVVKMEHCSNEARRLITLELLNKIKWINTDRIEYGFNQRGKKITKYCYKFEI